MADSADRRVRGNGILDFIRTYGFGLTPAEKSPEYPMVWERLDGQKRLRMHKTTGLIQIWDDATDDWVDLGAGGNGGSSTDHAYQVGSFPAASPTGIWYPPDTFERKTIGSTGVGVDAFVEYAFPVEILRDITLAALGFLDTSLFSANLKVALRNAAAGTLYPTTIVDQVQVAMSGGNPSTMVSGASSAEVTAGIYWLTFMSDTATTFDTNWYGRSSRILGMSDEGYSIAYLASAVQGGLVLPADYPASADVNAFFGDIAFMVPVFKVGAVG